jgi:hypothetical protein
MQQINHPNRSRAGRGPDHYRDMLERNPGATIGFTLAARMIVTIRRGCAVAADAEEVRTAARRLRAQYGEVLSPEEVRAEVRNAEVVWQGRHLTTYTVRTSDGCGFRMTYDPSHPSSPILVDVFSEAGDPEEKHIWATTGYQAADARDAKHAAELVQETLDDASVETVVRDPEGRR